MIGYITQIDTSSPLVIAEAAIDFIYNARARLYAAKIIINTTDNDFLGEAHKNDVVLYLIEDIHNQLKGYESILSRAVDDILTGNGGRMDRAEVLPENSSKAVFGGCRCATVSPAQTHVPL